MRTKKVIVVPYDPEWKAQFWQIAEELKQILGDLALAVEHVGSTAVPGLAAKPILDIDVVIRDCSVFSQVVQLLENGGYYHEGNLGIEGREAFGYSGKEYLQKHHLYVCPADSGELRRHLAFRDYLRSHEDAAGEYGRIKINAARKFPDSIEDYLRMKGPFIEEIYRQCGVQC